MSTEQLEVLEQLARRAVACKRWRWMPGMQTMCRVHVIEGGYDYLIGYRQGATRDGGGLVDTGDAVGFLPDLSDPATVGCLLQIVRELWGDGEAYASNYGGYDSVTWAVTSPLWDHKRNEETQQPWFSCMIGQGQTEAEALVNALEDANGN